MVHKGDFIMRSQPCIIMITCHPLDDARIVKHWNFLKTMYANARFLKIKWQKSEIIANTSQDYSILDLSTYNKFYKRIILFFEAFFNGKIMTLLREISKDQTIILHIHDPELIPVTSALKWKFSNLKIVYDKHEYHFFSFRSTTSIERWFYESIFRRWIDSIVVVTKEMSDETKKTTRQNMPIEIIPNYPSINLFPQKNIIDKINNIDNFEMRFVYFGSLLNINRDVSCIFSCSEKILQSFPRAIILIGGRGISKEDLIIAKRLESSYPASFFYLGEVSYNFVISETSKAHFGFLALKARSEEMKKYTTVSNNKIFEYLISGTIPLLSMQNIDIDIPSKYYISLTDNFIKKIEEMQLNKRLRMEMRNYACSRSWENVSTKYKYIYNLIA